MGASTVENSTNLYQTLLSSQNSFEFREEAQKQAELLAFYSHLKALGREQDVAPDLVRGKTRISIPAYFALEGHGANPVNEAALALLPRYSYRPSYGNTTDVQVDEAGLRRALGLTGDELEAARRGHHIQYLVASRLNLGPAAGHIHLYTEYYDIDPPIKAAKQLISDVTRDLNEAVVGEVSEVAEMVRQRSYTDFLDYLMDAKRVITGRVETIFSAEANTIPE